MPTRFAVRFQTLLRAVSHRTIVAMAAIGACADLPVVRPVEYAPEGADHEVVASATCAALPAERRGFRCVTGDGVTRLLAMTDDYLLELSGSRRAVSPTGCFAYPDAAPPVWAYSSSRDPADGSVRAVACYLGELRFYPDSGLYLVQGTTYECSAIDRPATVLEEVLLGDPCAVVDGIYSGD